MGIDSLVCNFIACNEILFLTKAGLRRWGKGSLLVQWIWVISHGGVCLTHHTPFLLLVALLRQAQDEQCSNIETLADLY